MKIKARVLPIASVISVFVGFMLWMVVGPAIVLTGIPTSSNHKWSFFQAYSWLSYPESSVVEEPSVVEISSTYWLGFAISIIGLCILVVGVIGVILTFVLKYSRTCQKKESRLG